MTITVFIADDHTIVADGLRALLEDAEGITVVGQATDGREAMREIIRLRPDIALIDIAMPELNGIEATHLLGKAEPGTQVIVLSMYADVGHVHRALKAGARGYVVKASAGKELVGAITAVHAGNCYLSPRIARLVVEDFISDERFVDPLQALSSRERQVLQLCVEGKSTADIAAALSISPRTVETYRARLMEKLDIKDLPALVRFAIQEGISPLE
jgi:DNA-binding NarL/FixJ family response regulator